MFLTPGHWHLKLQNSRPSATVKPARVNFQITFARQAANSIQAQTLPETGQAGASKRGNIGAV